MIMKDYVKFAMKIFNRIFNIIVGTFIGIFIGHSLFVIYEYNKYPKIYALQSLPWYTSILLYGVFTIIIILILFVIKFVIKNIQKRI